MQLHLELHLHKQYEVSCSLRDVVTDRVKTPSF